MVVAFLTRWWPVITGVGLVAAFFLWLAFHDRAVIADHDAAKEAATAPAHDAAAQERVTDAVNLTRNQQDLQHAIDTAPTGGALSPAAHALACERLRQLGRVPAACGSAGGNGGQAGAR